MLNRGDDAASPEPFENHASPRLPWPTRWWQVLFPWTYARFVLRPIGVYGFEEDPGVQRLKMWRRLAWGIAFVLFVTRFNPGASARVPDFAVYSATANGFVAVMTVLVVCVLAVARAEPAVRATASRAVLRPLIRLVAVLAVVALLVWADVLWIADGKIGTVPTTIDMTLPGSVGRLIWATVWSHWVLVLLASFVWYAGRYLLAVRDVHPVLEPVSAMIVAWIVFLVNEVDAIGDAVRIIPEEPPLLAETPSKLAFSLVTVLSLSLICIIEVRRMGGFGLIRHHWK